MIVDDRPADTFMAPRQFGAAYTPMIDPLQRAALLALYQVSIAVGIVLLPVALLAHRAGVTLPVGRLVERLGRAYENAG